MKSGRVAEVLGTEDVDDEGGHAAQVKADPGGGANLTADRYGPPGFDGAPLPGDTVRTIGGPGAGQEDAVGFADTKNPRVSKPGEGRVYARRSDGTPVAALYAKLDGSIEIEVFEAAGNQPIEIKTSGPVILSSPDVRIGDLAGRAVACVGDLVSGVLRALAPPGAAGGPILPVPPATPSPSGGVSFSGQIISGRSGVKAGTQGGS